MMSDSYGANHEPTLAHGVPILFSMLVFSIY
jgi:hypothetical protein